MKAGIFVHNSEDVQILNVDQESSEMGLYFYQRPTRIFVENSKFSDNIDTGIRANIFPNELEDSIIQNCHIINSGKKLRFYLSHIN